MTSATSVSAATAPAPARNIGREGSGLISFDTSLVRIGREHFAGMDLLRAGAALTILVYHAHSIAGKNALRQGIEIAHGPQWWYACIDLFFVMSGFLMVHMSRQLYGSARGVLIFASRRLVRTPPLYWFYTLVFTAVWLLFPFLPGGGHIDVSRVVHSLLFIPNSEPPIILVAWTLYLEILFYTLFGLTLFLPFSKGPWVAIAMLVGLSLIGLMPGAAQSVFALWTDPLLLDFVLGILVALLYFRGASLSTLGSILLLGVAFIALMALPDVGHRNFMRLPTYGLAAACVVAVVTWRRVDMNLGAFGRWLAPIGASAYSLYLTHIICLKVLEAGWFRVFPGEVSLYAYIVVGSLVSIVGGLVAYAVVEKPLTQLLRPLAMKR